MINTRMNETAKKLIEECVDSFYTPLFGWKMDAPEIIALSNTPGLEVVPEEKISCDGSLYVDFVKCPQPINKNAGQW